MIEEGSEKKFGIWCVLNLDKEKWGIKLDVNLCKIFVSKKIFIVFGFYVLFLLFSFDVDYSYC